MLRSFARVVLVGMLLLVPLMVRGQVSASLAGALEQVKWDGGEDRVLLVVAGRETLPKGSEEEDAEGMPKVIVSPLVAGRRYRLREVAVLYDRRVVQVGAVTTLVPNRMTVLNTQLEKRDTFQTMTRYEKAYLLFNSLSPAQLRILGSERGLGMSDMATTLQCDLMASLLGEEMRVYQNREDAEVSRLLSREQRLGVRVRLVRMPVFCVPLRDDRNGGIVLDSVPNGIAAPGVLKVASEKVGEETEMGTLLGGEVPSRLKASDVDYRSVALNPPVVLQGAEDVQEVMERCAAATGIELYADARYGRLSVGVQGETARVMKAVADQEMSGKVPDTQVPEPKYWHRVDTVSASLRMSKKVLEAARIPGIGGVVLSEVVTPGYAAYAMQEDYGYTLPLRLRFIRRFSVDPLDILPARDYVTNGAL